MASRGPAVNDVIPNPYDATIFNDSVEVVRDKDLVFMGRITGDKGVFDFISMVARLADNHPTLSATIIGNGPEFEQAQTRVRELNLTNHVRFTGELAPGPAAGELRRHRVFVFPALWDEPFGIVTLEAIACGAAVVAYASGGIPEAVGPCGIVVPTGDLGRLADATSRLLTDETARTDLLSHRETHLQRHRADTVAQRYVDCIKRDSARPLS